MRATKRLLNTLRPVQKVAAISMLMAVLAAGLMLTADLTSHHSNWVAVLPFVLGFVITESMVFHIEIRKQAHTFSIHEALLVMGLFALDPLALLLARVVGGALALLVFRRPPLFKAAFNVAMFALEAAIAVRVYQLFGHGHDVSLVEGLAAIAAAAAADTVSVLAVFGAISIFEGPPRRRHAIDVFNAQMLVMLIAGSVGVVGAGALNVGLWQVIFLMVMGAGAIAVFRQHALTASRYTGLQTLYEFSRTIANDVDVDRVLRTAMDDVVDVIAASTVALIVPESGSFFGVGGYSLEAGDLVSSSLSESMLAEWKPIEAAEPTIFDAQDFGPDTRRFLDLDSGQILVADLALEGERVLFVATKTAAAVGVFDSASADQVGALARQLSATLRNGLFVRQLDEASRRDELTGLDNRGELLERIDSIPNGQPCTVFAVGLVYFDTVNETLGHGTGDLMLVEAARRIADVVGQAAISVARLNGATFAIAVPEPISAELEALVDETIDAFARHESGSELRLDMRCRVGIAESTVEETVGAATLVRRADLALAEALKTNSRVFSYSPDLDSTQQRSVSLIGALREAIEGDQFELWFQPKINLADGEMTGAEALIRWTHPQFGPVRPDEFIELAETAGLIGEITELVLDMAAVEAKRWSDKGNPIKIAVNLSIHDLVDSALPGKIESLLDRYDLETMHLGFELTETALAADERKVISVLTHLRDAGFSLFVDDYGTGYSSLSYLRSLPVDTLKIDRAFITNLASDQHDYVIVKSTIELAHSLGLEVVAEGVEDAGSYEILRRLGCETAQGFFMAKPMPSEQLDEWYANLPTLRSLLGYGADESTAGVGEEADAIADPEGWRVI